ncbi:MAG: hypothetical protein COA67_00410 [Lutibacter sp.]|nr:MAG: hypothetical protein COA67_00410 [Lutibacter sp.]
MKTLTIISSLFFLAIFNFSSEKEYKTTESVDTETTQCYWNGYNNTYSKRGVSCGSDTSLKVFYTNPYSYKVRVAFYLRDAQGYTSGRPYVIHVAAGRRGYTHKCYSNGRYSVLVSRYDQRCSFPDYN